MLITAGNSRNDRHMLYAAVGGGEGATTVRYRCSVLLVVVAVLIVVK